MLVKIRDFIRKYKQLVFYFGLAIVGIVFTIGGSSSLSQPRIEGIEVEATIVNIVKEEGITNSDGYTEFTYTVYVDYTDQNGVYHSGVEYPDHTDDMVVGNKITVKYNPNNPDEIVMNTSIFVSFAFIIVGALAIGFSVVKIVNTIKKKDINEFNKVDMTSVSPHQIESIKNNNEETKEYYFHFTGVANQSYIMETMDRKPIYEAKCDSVGILSNYKFTFINHLTKKETNHEVSHVVSSSYDSFVTSSKFKIDDVNVWDILGKEGYSLRYFTGKGNFKVS